jgi:hypothetical protein
MTLEAEESTADRGFPSNTRKKRSNQMAAPQTNTTQRETVDFPLNVPVALSLAYSEGRVVAGHFGERFMYTTTDKRRFFVDPPVAARITELGINVREKFTITRKPARRKGAPDEWEVARVPGEQPNGTLVLPNDGRPEPKPPQRASSAGASLVDQANDLVDAFAQVLERALTKHGGKVKPDEVRAIFLTAAINGSRGRAA